MQWRNRVANSYRLAYKILQNYVNRHRQEIYLTRTGQDAIEVLASENACSTVKLCRSLNVADLSHGYVAVNNKVND